MAGYRDVIGDAVPYEAISAGSEFDGADQIIAALEGAGFCIVPKPDSELPRQIASCRIKGRGPGKDGLFIRALDGEWLAAVYDSLDRAEPGDMLPARERAEAFTDALVAMWNASRAGEG